MVELWGSSKGRAEESGVGRPKERGCAFRSGSGRAEESAIGRPTESSNSISIGSGWPKENATTITKSNASTM